MTPTASQRDKFQVALSTRANGMWCLPNKHTVAIGELFAVVEKPAFHPRLCSAKNDAVLGNQRHHAEPRRSGVVTNYDVSTITESFDTMDVTPLQQRFILHFGEMGSRWGINRTVGQIYALLYLSEGYRTDKEPFGSRHPR